MYIEYHSNQKEIWDTDGWVEDIAAIENPLDDSEVVPEFKPTRLIRVSNMQTVDGVTVKSHYWALSYSWDQSGEIIKTDSKKYERKDEGKHVIVPKSCTDLETGMLEEVKFEKLIQQMCIDFGIEYIWWDQTCINQEDEDEKLREIKRMHEIYKNARCTLVLIPELKVAKSTANIDIIPESHWSKRMWTLEEAYLSKSMLFVGQNAHLWADSVEIEGPTKYAKFLSNIRQKNDKWKACTALWYASTRSSSKEHDRIYALVNIFPELKYGIKFDYKQDVLELMINFYCLLAKNDATILLFGSPIKIDLDEDIINDRQAQARSLPSWTGANGVHMTQDMLKSVLYDRTFQYTVTEECMCLTSDFIYVGIETATVVERFPDYNIHPRLFTPDGLPRNMFPINSSITKHESTDLTFVTTTPKSQDAYNQNIADYGLKATHFLPLEKGNETTFNTLSRPTHLGGFLSLTEECSKCIIIFGLTFVVGDYHCYPVIKKIRELRGSRSQYQSIGICFAYKSLDFGSIVQLNQEFCIK